MRNGSVGDRDIRLFVNIGDGNGGGVPWFSGLESLSDVAKNMVTHYENT